MKQLIRHDILVMAFIFGAISIFGVNCTKDTTNAQKDGSTGLVSSCGEKLDASTVLGLIRNDHDAVDDKITLICYHYAQAIRQLAKNQTHLCYMVNAMIAADDTGVSLADLAQGNSTFAQALNAQLRSSVNTDTGIYPKGTEQPSPIYKRSLPR